MKQLIEIWQGIKSFVEKTESIVSKVKSIIWVALVIILLLGHIINALQKHRGPVIKPGPQNNLPTIIAITNSITNFRYITPADALSEINQRRTNAFTTSWVSPVFKWVLPNSYGDRWGTANITYDDPYNWLITANVLFIPSISAEISIQYRPFSAFQFYIGPAIGYETIGTAYNFKAGLAGTAMFQKLFW